MNINPPSNIEAEVKLEITEQIYSELLIYFPIVNDNLQINWFFDTPNRILSANRWATRLRFEKARAFLTAKGPKSNNDRIQIRPEYEIEISLEAGKKLINGFNLKNPTLTPLQMLNELFGELELIPLVNFFNRRIDIRWKEWDMEIDKTFISNSCFYELEVELEPHLFEKFNIEISQFFKLMNWEMKYSKTNKLLKVLNAKS